MSDHCTNKPKYCSVKDENENQPLFLDNSDYNYVIDDKNYDEVDRFTIWKTEKYDPTVNCNAVFDVNFNEKLDNTEKKNINKEQCVCINAWKQLQHSFELTDEELLRMYQLKKMVPDDIFTCMPIDLNNDDCGDDLEDFKLDGEYLFTQSEDLNREYSNDIHMVESTTSVKGKDLAVDKPKEQAVNQVTTNPVNTQIKSVTNNNKNVIDTTNNKNKPFRPNTHENVNISNKKQRIDGSTKVPEKEKSDKRCVELVENYNLNYSKKGIQYLYTYGESYRGGIYTGHKNCADCWVPIPKDKGWITDKFLTNKRKKIFEQVGRMHQRVDQKRLEGEKSLMNDKNMKKKELNSKQPIRSIIPTISPTANLTIEGQKTAITKQDLITGVAVVTAKEIKDAVPIMEFSKKDGKYKITMNCLTSDGRLDPLYKPVVFKFGVPKHLDQSDILSSSSSINFQFVPPETIYARNYQKGQNDVSTMYDIGDLVEKIQIK